MKRLMWSLLLVNMALAGYFIVSSMQVQPSLIKLDSSPNKVSLLDSHALALLPKKTAEVSALTTPEIVPLSTSCYEWGVFSKNNLSAAQNALRELSLTSTEHIKNSAQAPRFWVYIPSLNSAALAQAKAEELGQLGIQDIFIVQEPQWRNAISFGVFQDETLASHLLSELKAKGINGVTKNRFNPGKEHVSLLLKDVPLSTLNALRNAKAEFPNTELKPMACEVGN